ncbi:hypothetical protein OR1_00906 [Geobacter sp. OR-1]|uniref:hypothetical protein n=1 Tax=Geobacter sp. OR-1 TaxID=1266765 RepID=UPI000542A42B|nr:hypothetical protein [Geobacter sp. OR-1]GAM08634.1 hypothetical protein OR1_00906 [Geobacter sp. OR-1]
MKCDVYRCSYGIGKQGENKRGILVSGIAYQCQSGNQPLSQWVELNYQRLRVSVISASPLVVVCVDCYRKIFGQYPMPSTYEGNQYGKLVTPDDEKRRNAQAAASYSTYFDEDPMPAVRPDPPSAIQDLIFAKTHDDLLFEDFVRKARGGS